MLEFARWKYILVAVVLALAFVFALPNVFGEDAALQVARKDRAAVDAAGQKSVEDFLRGKGISYSRSYIDTGRLMVHFADVPNQLKARDAVNDSLASEYVTALSFASRSPDWLHVDLYAWNPKDRPGRPAGGEAQAVRALHSMLAERYGWT